MLLPVSLLALLSIAGGFLGFAIGQTPVLESFLDEVGVTLAERELTTAFVLSPEMLMSVGGAFLGAIAALILYNRYPHSKLSQPIRFFQKSFYINELYDNVIVRPLEALSRLIADKVEAKVFDGSIVAATTATQRTAHWMQGLQSGQIRSYAAWMVLGSVVLVLYLVM